jgi:hypothetical protein
VVRQKFQRAGLTRRTFDAVRFGATTIRFGECQVPFCKRLKSRNNRRREGVDCVEKNEKKMSTKKKKKKKGKEKRKKKLSKERNKRIQKKKQITMRKSKIHMLELTIHS